MPALTARELRDHFSRRRITRPNYFALAAAAARQQAASVATAEIVLDSLVITADAMPHHYIARAVILDLQPSDLVSAIDTVEETIRRTYPTAQRTGWRGACDGLTLYFHAWTQPSEIR